MGRIKIHLQERTVYRNWHSMIHRCKRNSPGYENISVCSRWQKYDNFYSDMISSYQEGLTIDRIDNSAGYSPENCRWATPKQQARNRRSNVMLTFRGKTQCMAAWADEFGIQQNTLRQRLVAYGWTVEEALTGKRG